MQPYFNPRTREGCDSIRVIVIGAGRGISIHAPVKGATIEDTVYGAGG